MWQFLANIFGGSIATVVDSSAGLVRTIWGDRAAKDAAASTEALAAQAADAQSQQDALTQFASEFVARNQRTWWDSLVDGLNRLPRPFLVLGVMLSFIWPSIDPVGYVEYIKILALIPEQVWYICYLIVGFYFGMRTLEKLPTTWKIEPRVLDLAKEIASERTARSQQKITTVSAKKGDTGEPESVVVQVKEPANLISSLTPLARGIRNNNPGNIEGTYFGAIGNDGRFAIYKTPEDGIRAIDTQLTRYYEGKTTGKPLCTIREMISTWAPRNENDTKSYIDHVAREVGCSPDIDVEWSDIRIREKMIKAIIDHENGTNNPYTHELITAALASKMIA